ncbi:HipA domain-containing protein [bacterium AH-315-M10]|nr:HipA domain-containing protein [bacterium AH-315-M10]
MGELVRTAHGCRLEFAESFLADDAYSDLSYCIPKSTRPLEFHGDSLPPFFAGLLPEGRRLDALVRNLKTSKDDLFSLFVASGRRCIGDIYAADGHFPKSSTVPRLSQINFLQYFEQTVLAEGANPGDGSIAGVQEKISASMISFPLNVAREEKSYILKLNPPDKPSLVENEHCCLKLASRCGLPVCRTKIVRDKEQNPGLLVERFDRRFSSELGRSVMIHQEDACQFLDRFPADKYRLSINEIAQGIVEHAPAPQIEILNLLRLVAFSYMIGNGDLHAKNISLFSPSGVSSAELTPGYDLLSTTVYGDHQMALKIDGRDDRIKRATLIGFGKRFDVAEKALKRMLDQLLSRFEQHRIMLSHIPVDPKQMKHLERVCTGRAVDLG